MKAWVPLSLNPSPYNDAPPLPPCLPEMQRGRVRRFLHHFASFFNLPNASEVITDASSKPGDVVCREEGISEGLRTDGPEDWRLIDVKNVFVNGGGMDVMAMKGIGGAFDEVVVSESAVMGVKEELDAYGRKKGDQVAKAC